MTYKEEFVKFMADCGVLTFGDFTLKSGRKSPFFMNAGAYVTGSQLKKLGEYYARAIHETYGDDFDVLFGPAYKGIPLGVVTAIAYSELYGKEVRYCSDRKEEKDHGADHQRARAEPAARLCQALLQRRFRRLLRGDQSRDPSDLRAHAGVRDHAQRVSRRDRRGGKDHVPPVPHRRVFRQAVVHHHVAMVLAGDEHPPGAYLHLSLIHI